MSKIASLSEFLEAIGVEIHVFDMGRRVSRISPELLLHFERTDVPYPLPLQQQAWFGMLLASPQRAQSESSIWFLRFPLDEQGKLVLAARDDFMHRLLESLDNNLRTVSQREQMPSAPQDNPYAFQPRPERMAVFHAKLTLALKQPASGYYAHARAYFSGELGWDQWSFLGYQGIADIAARLRQEDHARLLTAAIPWLPPSPLEALCHCLENETIPEGLAQALLARVHDTLMQTHPDPQILTAAIRGVACAGSVDLRQALIHAVLSHDIARRGDILAAIGGRAWESLCDESLREIYLERLAGNDQGQHYFNTLLSDLLYLPATRDGMLTSLRNPRWPGQLAESIGLFLQTV